MADHHDTGRASAATFDGDEIGPTLDLADLALPPGVGEGLAQLHGRDAPLENGGEWVEAMRSSLAAAEGRQPTEADLCHADDGAHSVRVGDESASFVCVLDALMVPFIREAPGTVHSEAPGGGGQVEIDVRAGGAVATPADAVVSLGVARNGAPDAAVTPERVYAEVCPYIHAFTSAGAYEQWAGGVDAATTSVPVETGVAMARELAAELIDDGGTTA